MTGEETWRPRLQSLCGSIRRSARIELARAYECGELASVARAVRQGAGDVTYAIDDVTEHVVDWWLERMASETPLSLLTEDTGWRHFGPDGHGGARELAGFDHGGPRIALDPIDGTRNLIADLRSAWTVVSYAPPGATQPRLGDVTLGIVSEIPDTRAAQWRSLAAERGAGCGIELRTLENDALVAQRELRADGDARADHGYFAFFRYAPDQRPALARIEAAFFERLRVHAGAELRHVFDDQYISNAGQLTLLSLGTYRMIADLRGWLARRTGAVTITSHPYDVAGAILCAREAGCVVSGPHGAELDFPIDVTTPVDFIGWANAATAARLSTHLELVMNEAC